MGKVQRYQDKPKKRLARQILGGYDYGSEVESITNSTVKTLNQVSDALHRAQQQKSEIVSKAESLKLYADYSQTLNDTTQSIQEEYANDPQEGLKVLRANRETIAQSYLDSSLSQLSANKLHTKIATNQVAYNLDNQRWATERETDIAINNVNDTVSQLVVGGRKETTALGIFTAIQAIEEVGQEVGFDVMGDNWEEYKNQQISLMIEGAIHYAAYAEPEDLPNFLKDLSKSKYVTGEALVEGSKVGHALAEKRQKEIDQDDKLSKKLLYLELVNNIVKAEDPPDVVLGNIKTALLAGKVTPEEYKKLNKMMLSNKEQEVQEGKGVDLFQSLNLLLNQVTTIDPTTDVEDQELTEVENAVQEGINVLSSINESVKTGELTVKQKETLLKHINGAKGLIAQLGKNSKLLMDSRISRGFFFKKDNRYVKAFKLIDSNFPNKAERDRGIIRVLRAMTDYANSTGMDLSDVSREHADYIAQKEIDDMKSEREVTINRSIKETSDDLYKGMLQEIMKEAGMV